MNNSASTDVKATAPESAKETAQGTGEPVPASESYLRSLGRIFYSSATAWMSHRAASKGAALALYTLFSLAPILILVVAVASRFFDQDTVKQQLLQQLSMLIGQDGGDVIKGILAGPKQQHDSLTAGLISGGLLLVSATSAFAELKDSLDELWEIPPSQGSGIWAFLRERFLSFGLLLVLTLMLLISLAVSTGLAAAASRWNVLGGDAAFQVLATALSDAVAFAIVTLLFAVIYKYLPATRIAWSDVLVGSLLTAVLFMIGKIAIGLYLGHGGFNTTYGAAGSIVALITWIYYSAQIFFYGSLFTHEYAFRIGSRTRDRQRAKSQSTVAAVSK